MIRLLSTNWCLCEEIIATINISIGGYRLGARSRVWVRKDGKQPLRAKPRHQRLVAGYRDYYQDAGKTGSPPAVGYELVLWTIVLNFRLPKCHYAKISFYVYLPSRLRWCTVRSWPHIFASSISYIQKDNSKNQVRHSYICSAKAICMYELIITFYHRSALRAKDYISIDLCTRYLKRLAIILIDKRNFVHKNDVTLPCKDWY